MITPDRVQLFVALLTLVALATIAAAVSPAVRVALAPVALWYAAAVAATATLGSLYFSEVAHYTPCRLCWYQRIAMYPLAVILLVAAWRRDRDVRWYVLPVAALGFLVAAYHYALERVPSLDRGACDPDVPCTLEWFEEFGFMTLPFMAAAGFAAVAVLTLIARPGGEP